MRAEYQLEQGRLKEERGGVLEAAVQVDEQHVSMGVVEARRLMNQPVHHGLRRTVMPEQPIKAEHARTLSTRNAGWHCAVSSISVLTASVLLGASRSSTCCKCWETAR